MREVYLVQKLRETLCKAGTWGFVEGFKDVAVLASVVAHGCFYACVCLRKYMYVCVFVFDVFMLACLPVCKCPCLLTFSLSHTQIPSVPLRSILKQRACSHIHTRAHT